jgi:Ca2+-binding EF-hand superfamily protein
MSSSSHIEMSARQLRDNVEKAFNKLDTNRDGVLTREEFVNSCLNVSSVYYNMIKHKIYFILL